MTTAFAIRTIFQIALAAFVVYGIINEQKFIDFEYKVICFVAKKIAIRKRKKAIAKKRAAQAARRKRELERELERERAQAAQASKKVILFRNVA